MRFRALVLFVLLPAGLGRAVPPVGDEAPRDEFSAAITPESFDARRLARAIFAETNRVRRGLELDELMPSDEADAAASIQASLGYMPGLVPHTNPFYGVATLAERVQRVGLSAVRAGENAARLPIIDTRGQDHFGYKVEDGVKLAVDLETGERFGPHTYASCAADFVRRWMKSPGHRENLLSRNFRVLGCAVQLMRYDDFDQIYAVQVFITPRPSKKRG
ncbi:MAG TPA: CAP domain-containing protein [Opitutaceae bacterium]|nr:CAP domain-containing protein [Opitutaceae bacterium]